MDEQLAQQNGSKSNEGGRKNSPHEPSSSSNTSDSTSSTDDDDAQNPPRTPSSEDNFAEGNAEERSSSDSDDEPTQRNAPGKSPRKEVTSSTARERAIIEVLTEDHRVKTEGLRQQLEEAKAALCQKEELLEVAQGMLLDLRKSVRDEKSAHELDAIKARDELLREKLSLTQDHQRAEKLWAERTAELVRLTDEKWKRELEALKAASHAVVHTELSNTLSQRSQELKQANDAIRSLKERLTVIEAKYVAAETKLHHSASDRCGSYASQLLRGEAKSSNLYLAPRPSEDTPELPLETKATLLHVTKLLRNVIDMCQQANPAFSVAAGGNVKLVCDDGEMYNRVKSTRELETVTVAHAKQCCALIEQHC